MIVTAVPGRISRGPTRSAPSQIATEVDGVHCGRSTMRSVRHEIMSDFFLHGALHNAHWAHDVVTTLNQHH